MRTVKYVQYYDPFLKEWNVASEKGTDNQIRFAYRIYEECGVRLHCSLYKVEGVMA